jgi:hypothetical protein
MAIAITARYIALENGARLRRKTSMTQPLCSIRIISSCREGRKRHDRVREFLLRGDLLIEREDAGWWRKAAMLDHPL